MKNIVAITFFLIPLASFSQFINCKVQDAETKQPLYYATIYYGKQTAITFTDSTGNFFIRSEILNEKDSIKIEFIGYSTLTVSSQEIIEGSLFRLHKSSFSLQEIVVSNCSQYQEREIESNLKMKLGNHYSAGPFSRTVYIGKYENEKQPTGFISKINFHVNTFPLVHENFDILIRIHWYLWDAIKEMPGKELTDTNIILKAYKRGWNRINIPDRSIYFDNYGVAIGIEFLYPSTLEKEYYQIKTEKERNKWMIQNMISVGMFSCENKHEGFIKLLTAGEPFFLPNPMVDILKPGLNFTIRTCKQ